MTDFAGHRRSALGALCGAVMAALATATISPALAQPATLPDKPFAEHRIALQLSDNDPKKQSLVISVAYNLLKAYDPDKVAIEVVTFGPPSTCCAAKTPTASWSKAWSRKACASMSA